MILEEESCEANSESEIAEVMKVLEKHFDFLEMEYEDGYVVIIDEITDTETTIIYDEVAEIHDDSSEDKDILFVMGYDMTYTVTGDGWRFGATGESGVEYQECPRDENSGLLEDGDFDTMLVEAEVECDSHYSASELSKALEARMGKGYDPSVQKVDGWLETEVDGNVVKIKSTRAVLNHVAHLIDE